MKTKSINWKIKVLDQANRIIEMIGSTEDTDRAGDSMKMNGVQLGNYLKNPVILANHCYGCDEKPTVIGRALDVRIDGTQLIFKIQFAETGNAKDWFYLYANGFMNASSIGFNPIKYEPNDNGGYDYTEWELLELSLVAVPCNPNAVQRAFAEGKISKSFESQIIKGAIPYKKFPLADENAQWDGPAQIKAADVDTLKLICAWYDSNNPDVKGSYKLPHHEADGKHNTVWKGVAAAMGVLLGAQGGVDISDEDRKKVYDHLDKHYKEFGKDVPEFKAIGGEDVKIKAIKDMVDKAVQPYKDKISSLEIEKASLVAQLKTGATLSNASKEKLKNIHDTMEKCTKELQDCHKNLKDFIGEDQTDNDQQSNNDSGNKSLETEIDLSNFNIKDFKNEDELNIDEETVKKLIHDTVSKELNQK